MPSDYQIAVTAPVVVKTITGATIYMTPSVWRDGRIVRWPMAAKVECPIAQRRIARERERRRR